MYILGIDTSTEIGTAGIVWEEGILAEYTIGAWKRQSELIIPAIEGFLGDLEISPSDIDGVGVGIGPGSFTGVRIGVTFAKALAYVLQKPITGISTLDCIAVQAANCSKHAYLCPIIDAKGGRIYTALYKQGCDNYHNIPERVGNYLATNIEELLFTLEDKDGTICFAGDGVKKYGEQIVKSLGSRGYLSELINVDVRGASVAYLSMVRIKDSNLDNCYDLAPLYLRKSRAEKILQGDA